MHEIVTIQIGQQANFLGTHFWNAQVSDILTYAFQASVNSALAPGVLLYLRRSNRVARRP